MSIYIGSLVGLTLLWFLWYYRIRAVLLASFRHRLFEIRDRLFDYAAAGNIAFDDPAYARLRSLMNSMIRFAHKVTFIRGMLLYWAIDDPDYAQKEINSFLEPLQALPPDKATILLKLHADMLKAMLIYVIQRTPVLWIGLAVFSMCLIARGTFRKISAVIPMFGFKVPGIALLEAHAIDSEN